MSRRLSFAVGSIMMAVGTRLTWFVIPKALEKRGISMLRGYLKWKKFNKVGGHLNFVYGGAAGGAVVMSALV